MSRAQSYEVIVSGGGAAGTAAAIGAASAGAATLLVESAPFLGGAATLISVLTYCGLFTNHHNGNHEVSAKAFVDASGAGDLAFFGGASLRYGNHGTVQTGTLSMRLGGITADADLSPASWTPAIQQAKQRGEPLVSEHGLFVRVPITNHVATYFIDHKYDGRHAQSLTDAEIDGREQARAYLHQAA
jgi:hypothetical protein